MEGKILQRISKSRFIPKNSYEAIVGITNAICLENQFYLIVEQPSDIPGFAPSVKELPATEFLPMNWNVENQSTILSYKNRRKTGKTFTLSVVTLIEFPPCFFKHYFS